MRFVIICALRSNIYFETERMPKAWGKTYVALIPKIEHQKKFLIFGQFYYAMYVTKLSRKCWLIVLIRGIIGNLISREQCSFVP